MTTSPIDPSIQKLAQLQAQLVSDLSEVLSSHAATLRALGLTVTPGASNPSDGESTAPLRTRTDDRDKRRRRARVLEAVEAGCQANGGHAPYEPVYALLKELGVSTKAMAGWTTAGWFDMHNLDPARPKFISHYSLTEEGRRQLARDHEDGVI